MPFSAVAFPRESQPIPPGFGFPADSKRLEDMRDHNDVKAMRRHAWNVFAGLTQRLPDGRAIFETWYNVKETLEQPDVRAVSSLRDKSAMSDRRVNMDNWLILEPAQQLKEKSDAEISLPPPEINILYNPIAYQFIRSRKLFLNSTLEDLIKKKVSDIECFSHGSLTLKLVWWPILKDRVSSVPVWRERDLMDRNRARTGHDQVFGNDYSTWERVVAVDASRNYVSPCETAAVPYFDYMQATPAFAPPVQHQNVRLVPLASFFYHELTQCDLDRLRSVRNPSFLDTVVTKIYGKTFEGKDRVLVVGDFIVLVAIHIATKEIEDWTWTTLWWDDEPEKGRYAADRIPEVYGKWRNFLMDVTFSAETPRELDGSENIAFNPWLEAPLGGGVTSNCAACHQRSMWRLTVADQGNTARGKLDHHPYADHVGLDYVWSLTRTTPASTRKKN